MACASEGAKGESKDLEDCLGKDDVKVAKKAKLLEFVFELNGILEKKLVKNGAPSRLPARVPCEVAVHCCRRDVGQN